MERREDLQTKQAAVVFSGHAADLSRDICLYFQALFQILRHKLWVLFWLLNFLINSNGKTYGLKQIQHKALFKDSTISMPWELRNRWSRTIRYANELNTHVSHIFRQADEAVDKLAPWAGISELAMWWKDIPYSIFRLVYRDTSPISFYMFRN